MPQLHHSAVCSRKRALWRLAAGSPCDSPQVPVAPRAQPLSSPPLLCPAPRLDAPFGTEDNPVVVPSEFSERIVGVADPDDDSLVRLAPRLAADKCCAGCASCGQFLCVLLPVFLSPLEALTKLHWHRLPPVLPPQ